MNALLRVAILVRPEGSFQGGVIRGIGRFVRDAGNWECFFLRSGDAFSFARLSEWSGILLMPAQEELPVKTKVPLVLVAGFGQRGRMPHVASDDLQIGVLAARHFLDLKLRNFAFVGERKSPFSERRRQGFTATLAAQGLTCEVISAGSGSGPSRFLTRTELLHWLRDLPKPVGVFACTDSHGANVIELSREAGLRVPDDVAVLGVDNDELLCDFTMPPLSSIAQAGDRIGYEAARLLSELMAGRSVAQSELLIPPHGLIVRQSSNLLATDDGEVRKAVARIRASLDKPFVVKEILDSIGISRRSLERRFRAVVGHSPAQEVRLARIGRVKELLITTDMTVTEIARASGFLDVAHLSRSFHREAGVSPSDFRQAARA